MFPQKQPSHDKIDKYQLEMLESIENLSKGTLVMNLLSKVKLQSVERRRKVARLIQIQIFICNTGCITKYVHYSELHYHIPPSPFHTIGQADTA